MASLDGKVIATLEARRASDMVSLITRNGGTPYSAPALKEVPLDNSGEVAVFIQRFVSEPVAAVIFLTGVGTRALLEAAEAWGQLPQVLKVLQSMTVVARGPKPVAVLRQYNVRVDLVPPEPNTSHELLAMLGPLELRGKLVALQHYGEPNTFLREALLSQGVQLLEVSLYRWSLPDDQEPLVRFLRDVQAGVLDAVAATSKTQVQNLFTLAQHFGQEETLRDALNGPIAVAAVGPICAREWEAHGVHVDIEPEHPKMGHLVLALGQYFEAKQAIH